MKKSAKLIIITKKQKPKGKVNGFKKIPVEVVLSIVDVIVYIFLSFGISIIVAIGIKYYLGGSASIAFFVALLTQVVLRLLDEEFRKRILIIRFWYKHQDEEMPDWVYTSFHQKNDMKFINFMENRRPDISTKSVTTADTLKKDVNKSLLDD